MNIFQHKNIIKPMHNWGVLDFDLSYDITYESDTEPCIYIDKPLVCYFVRTVVFKTSLSFVYYVKSHNKHQLPLT